jgi:hypothetical protein
MEATTMSYQSLGDILAARGITDPDAADPSALDAAFMEAFERDLPLGFAYIAELVAKVRTTGQRLLQREDPHSPLGGQLTRLLGTDIARGVLTRRFGVAFGLYNCCAPVCALTAVELNMTASEQISLQSTPDC